jgi:hypothetical protein
MSTLTISIHLPPVGELETSGNGSSPTDDQMAEELQARQKFLDIVSPFFETLPNRPPHRSGNVSRVELLGGGVWSQLNRYLLLVDVDIGEPRLDQELLAILPPGSKVSFVGAFDALETWTHAARPRPNSTQRSAAE